MPNQIPNSEILINKRILVVGDVMLDRYWFGDVNRVSPEAPVPIVHVKREVNKLGGAANVALNVRSLGAHVTLLGAVGQDANGQSLADLLERNGISSEMISDKDSETIVKLRVIGRAQQMIRADFERVLAESALNAVWEKFSRIVGSFDLVLFSDYRKGTLQDVDRMIESCTSLGKKSLVDPKGSNWLHYRGATLLTPNVAELTQIIGSWHTEEDLDTKVSALIKKLALDALLLTRSEDGMTLFQRDTKLSFPTVAREVSDVTGAGDTVIATLAAMITSGLSLEDSTFWANRAGGLVVEKFGTSSVTLQELIS